MLGHGLGGCVLPTQGAEVDRSDASSAVDVLSGNGSILLESIRNHRLKRQTLHRGDVNELQN